MNLYSINNVSEFGSKSYIKHNKKGLFSLEGMSQRDVILSMVDAITITLTELNSKAKNQTEEFETILRCIPFFTELLSLINPQIAHELKQLQEVANDLMKFCNRCMNYISKESETANLGELISFLNHFISSCLISECVDAMTQLLVGILNIRDIPNSRAIQFSTLFTTFFEGPDLRSEFIKCDGILTAWFTYVAEPNNPLIMDIFTLFQTYLEFLTLPEFSTHVYDFLAAVSASFTSLSVESAHFVFPVIQKIVAISPKMYIEKLDEFQFFQSLYLFIISHQDEDPNLVSYLEFFTTLIPFSTFVKLESETKKRIRIPSLEMAINLISAMECKVPLRHRALKGIETILPYVTTDNSPFQVDQIAMIANAIPITDPESVYTFSSILLDLNIQANFDISPLIPFMQRFITLHLLLSIDMTKYISLFLEYHEEIAPFVPALFISIFKKINPEIFAILVNRYGHLFAFFVQHFEEPLKKQQLCQFLVMLIKAFPFYTDIGGAESCLMNIILSKKGYMFTRSIFSTLEEIASTTYIIDIQTSSSNLLFDSTDEFDLNSSMNDLTFDSSKDDVSDSFDEPLSNNSKNSKFVIKCKGTSTLRIIDGKFDVSSLIKVFTKTAKDCPMFRSECINLEVSLHLLEFHELYGTSSKVILDFISILSNHIYIPFFDAMISRKLKEVGFLEMNKEQLLRFALGLNQIENDGISILAQPQIDAISGSSSSISIPENEDFAFENSILQINEDGYQEEENDQSQSPLVNKKLPKHHVSFMPSPIESNNEVMPRKRGNTLNSVKFGGNNENDSSLHSPFLQPLSSANDSNPRRRKSGIKSFKSQMLTMDSASPSISSSASGNIFVQNNKNNLMDLITNNRLYPPLSEGTLCFPSILGHCSDYVFTSRYDLWICGRVGITAWLKESGRPISEFPSIINVVTQYARREHLEMILDHPKTFYHACSNLSKLPALFEFRKHYDSSFTISPNSEQQSTPYESTPRFQNPSNLLIKSFCFWFRIPDVSNEPTQFLTINSCIQLIFRNYEILHENKVIGNYDSGKWVFFCAAQDKDIPTCINIYLDLKPIAKLNSKVGFNVTNNNGSAITFGGKLTSTTWYIGGVIRLFSEIIPIETFTKIHSYGVASNKSSEKLNINAHSTSNSIEVIRKKATDSAPFFNNPTKKRLISDTSICEAVEFANIVNGDSLNRTEKPISIYSLLNYLQNVKLKSAFLMTKIVKYAKNNDFVNANFMLKAYCALKKHRIFNQSNESFARSISILYHTSPDVLTADTIDLIIECFERRATDTGITDKNVGFDWNSFFAFSFDYSLMFSNLAVVVVSKFFELNARYPIFDENSCYALTCYLFSLLSIPEFNKKLVDSIIDLILKISPDPSLIFFLLASYPQMAVGITDNSQPYHIDKDDDIIPSILNLLSNLIILKFNHYYLLSVLPSAMCCKLVQILIRQNLITLNRQAKMSKISSRSRSQTFGGLPKLTNDLLLNLPNDTSNQERFYQLDMLDYDEFFECLFHNSHMPDAWFSALSICTHSLAIDDLHNFSLNGFDLIHFLNLFKMFTLLISACYHLECESFWLTFAATLSEQLIQIIPSIPDKLVTKSLKFWVLQLMTFGQPFDKMSSFPPYPLAFTSEDILKYIETRGQKFPSAYGKSFTFQPVIYNFDKISISDGEINPKSKEIIDNSNRYVFAAAPKEFCINGKDKFQLILEKHETEFKEIYNSNVTYIATDWVDYVHSIISKFELAEKSTPVKEHPLTEILVRLLSTFVVHCPSLFHTILDTMSIFPNDLMMILTQKIIICSLNICEQKKIYHLNLIDCASKRAHEGWYTNQYVDIIQLIFKLINSIYSTSQTISIVQTISSNNNTFQIPISFYNAIIYGFSVVNGEDVPKLMNLIAASKHIFINNAFIMNFDLCLFFISQMFEHINILPNSFYTLWKYFVSMLKTTEQFQQAWNKTFAPQPSKLLPQQINPETNVDFNQFIQPLEIIENEGADGFVKWKAEKGPSFQTFFALLKDKTSNYRSQILNEMAASIDNLMKKRNEKSLEFVKMTNDIIMKRSAKVTLNKTKAASLRKIFREYYLFMNAFYLRKREILVSATFPIYFNTTKEGRKRKGITILSDPIFPTRRLEVSPINYSLPSFPDGTDKELFPHNEKSLPLFDEGNYNASIKELFSFCVVHTPFLLRYSPYQLHVQFSPVLPIQQYQVQRLLSLLINHGNNFTYSCNCSFLYGVDTINGCLLLSETHIYFAEGLQISETENSLIFTHENDFFSFQFYLQYIMTCHFGAVKLFQGHPIIEWKYCDLISVYPHIWIHKPFSITFHFIQGFNFILNFKKNDFEYLFPILKKFPQQFFETAPPTTPVHTVISVINSARYLQHTQKEITNRWMNGEIDTFTYLCILNRFGKRPTCDLTQYPVFPWIICDFDSNILNIYQKDPNSLMNDDDDSTEVFRDLALPMGQIGKERAERFVQFYKDTNNSYFYGIHYMHFGVVLYSMFRVDPFTFFSFLLHKGWDHPNRLFYSIRESWMQAAFNSPSDIKEVIPQFFTVPEIFENTSQLPLTQNDEGESIACVKLPQWAKTAREMANVFYTCMECDHVQKNINYWIDLIFGDKSRGQGARDARNLFHPLCYAHLVHKTRDSNAADDVYDPESLEDDISREASIISIINFGQVPQQVFTKPHPQMKSTKLWRILSSPIIPVNVMSIIETSAMPEHRIMDSESRDEIIIETNEPPQEDSNSSSSTMNSSTLKLLSEAIANASMSLTANWQKLRPDAFFFPAYSCYADNANNVATSNHKISAFVPPTGQLLFIEEGVVLISNKSMTELSKVTETDLLLTVSSVKFSNDGYYLGMTRRDGSFFLYKMIYQKGEAKGLKLIHIYPAYEERLQFDEKEDYPIEPRKIPLKKTEHRHIADIIDCTISSEHFIAFAASENKVLQFDIGLSMTMPSITLDFNVQHLEVDDTAALLYVAGLTNLAVLSISGQILITKRLTCAPITCIATSRLPEYFVGRFFTTGHSDGSMSFWSMNFRNNDLQQIGRVSLSRDSILSISLSSNSQRLIAATESNVFSCECQNSTGGVSPKLVKACRIAGRLWRKKRSEKLKLTDKNPNLVLTENDDGFIVISNESESDELMDAPLPRSSRSSSLPPTKSCLLPPPPPSAIQQFSGATFSIPFVTAAIGSTGGMLTGNVNIIGNSGSSGGNVGCTPLKKEVYAVECACCRNDIRKNSLVCMKCGRFVCPKCITKEMNALKTTVTCINCLPTQT